MQGNLWKNGKHNITVYLIVMALAPCMNTQQKNSAFAAQSATRAEPM